MNSLIMDLDPYSLDSMMPEDQQEYAVDPSLAVTTDQNVSETGISQPVLLRSCTP